MKEDAEKSREENSAVTKDTEELKQKYEELCKETEEKMGIMTTQLSE